MNNREQCCIDNNGNLGFILTKRDKPHAIALQNFHRVLFKSTDELTIYSYPSINKFIATFDKGFDPNNLAAEKSSLSLMLHKRDIKYYYARAEYLSDVASVDCNLFRAETITRNSNNGYQCIFTSLLEVPEIKLLIARLKPNTLERSIRKLNNNEIETLVVNMPKETI